MRIERAPATRRAAERDQRDCKARLYNAKNDRLQLSRFCAAAHLNFIGRQIPVVVKNRAVNWARCALQKTIVFASYFLPALARKNTHQQAFVRAEIKVLALFVRYVAIDDCVRIDVAVAAIVCTHQTALAKTPRLTCLRLVARRSACCGAFARSRL